MSLITPEIHDSLNTLTAPQLAALLVMRYGITQYGYTYTTSDDDSQEIPVTTELLASMDGAAIMDLFEESSHDDAINEIRYEADDEEVSGIRDWCHHSWDRNYDVNVGAFIMPCGEKALAFHYMTGGGKHGEPNAYDWVGEAKFIKVTGKREVKSITYSFEAIPDAE